MNKYKIHTHELLHKKPQNSAVMSGLVQGTLPASVCHPLETIRPNTYTNNYVATFWQTVPFVVLTCSLLFSSFMPHIYTPQSCRNVLRPAGRFTLGGFFYPTEEFTSTSAAWFCSKHTQHRESNNLSIGYFSVRISCASWLDISYSTACQIKPVQYYYASGQMVSTSANVSIDMQFENTAGFKEFVMCASLILKSSFAKLHYAKSNLFLLLYLEPIESYCTYIYLFFFTV